MKTQSYLMFYQLSAFCQKTAYNVGMQSYNNLSVLSIKDPEDNTTKKESGRYINMYYSTTNIKISTTSKLLNLSSFISSVGGNLGLFLGFSFMSAVLCCIKFLEGPTRKIYRKSMRIYSNQTSQTSQDQQENKENGPLTTPMWL